ncbi:MAG: leucyl aminopeptidase [Alphaproteobacteria bacterium]|nr:leucyl aminopeptidase [Alphaproteobacteria bacterium]
MISHVRFLLSAALVASAAPAVAAGGTPERPILTTTEAANSAQRPIAFATARPTSGVLVFAVRSKADIDAIAIPGVAAAAATAKFEGKAGKTLSLRGLGGYDRIVLAGAGDKPLSASDLADMGGTVAQEVKGDAAPVAIDLGALGNVDAAQVALGASLGGYRFDRYKTVGKTTPPSQPITIVTAAADAARATWTGDLQYLAQAVTFARDLQTEPANTLYPEEFVARVQAAFRGVRNVRIEVLDEAQMGKLGMGTFLGVGQGSARPSRLLLVHYTGGQGAPIAFVGKGITFDSGGTSIKPAAGMWEMKADMSGAASAVAAVWAIAKRGATANVIGVAALAENMPDGNAQRPGDVVRTMTGKTIEVINTDAEGRLVLTDANEYVVDRYKPAALVNIATLTGAVVRALDDEYAGLFARQEPLAAQLKAAGEAVGEHVWQLPLHDNYYGDMASQIADIRNSTEGGNPGAGFGAHFLQYFVPTSTPWAHIDIAGTNWTSGGLPTAPKGATAFGVRLFDAFVRNFKPVGPDASGGPK